MLPPIKYRSPLGVEIDLWKYGILKPISNFIVTNWLPGEERSNR